MKYGIFEARPGRTISLKIELNNCSEEEAESKAIELSESTSFNYVILRLY